MRMVMAAVGLVMAVGSAPVWAANAKHPYSNVDKRLDKGGDTGDAKVDALNQQQLDAARAANGPAPSGSTSMGAPMMKPGSTP